MVDASPRGKPPRRLAATALLLVTAAGAACRKGQPVGSSDAPDAETVGSEAPVAPAGDAALPPSVFRGRGDATDPAVAALGDDWLVAWTDDEGGALRALASTDRAARAGEAPAVVSEGPQSSRVRVAALADRALAAWWVGGGPGAVQVRPLDANGSPCGEATTLSGPGPAGAPEVAAAGEGFVVAWIENGKVVVARVDRDGVPVETATWEGGTERPPPHGRPADESAEPPPTEYGRASPRRPTLLPADGGLALEWVGDVWESDDVAASGLLRRRVTWPAAEDAVEIVEEERRGVERLAAAASDGQRVQLEQFRRSATEPWVLQVRDSRSIRRIAIEDLGPLAGTLAPRAGGGLLVAWPSPSRGGVAVARLGRGGEPRISWVPSGAPRDMLAAAVATRGSAGSGASERVAVVDREGARAVVRLLGPPPAGRPGEAPPPPEAHVLRETRGSPGGVHAVRVAGGDVAVVWSDGIGERYPVRLLWLSDDGTGLGPAGQPIDVTPDEPNCRVGSATAVGDAVVATLVCCNSPGMCDHRTYQVLVAVLRRDREPSVTAVTRNDGAYREAALALSGDRAAIVLARAATYGPQFVVRVVDTGDPDAVPAALAAAPDIEISAALSQDSYGPISAAWIGDGLVAGHFAGRGTGGAFRVVRVSPDGAVAETAAIPMPQPVWSSMAASGEGVVLLGTRARADETDTVVYRLDAGGKLEGATVVGRLMAPTGGTLVASPGGGVAVSWCDRPSGGVYLATTGAGGARTAGPTLANRPGTLPMGGATAPIPDDAGGARYALFSDGWDGAYALHWSLAR